VKPTAHAQPAGDGPGQVTAALGPDDAQVQGQDVPQVQGHDVPQDQGHNVTQIQSHDVPQNQSHDVPQNQSHGDTAAALAWGTIGQPVPPGLTAAPTSLPGTLTEAMLPADPMDLLRAWMDDVIKAGLPEPTAMVLATVSADQRPRARMVLLKGFDSAGFVFYTNRTSRKGSDVAEVPRACLLFPWQALHRQVIVEGGVVPLSTDASEPYFHSRPRGSQLGAWASRQSTVLASRAELDDRYEELERRWPEGTEVPMPDFWGGYRVEPETIEFWQGRPSRLHDRFRYTAAARGWTVSRLAP
jgi:pyridoxamine 5'-phosphate oxidase